MVPQLKTQPAPAYEQPGEMELVFGTYSSPPCFLHELDPDFLGVAANPGPRQEIHPLGDGAGQPATSKEEAAVPRPDSAP